MVFTNLLFTLSDSLKFTVCILQYFLDIISVLGNVFKMANYSPKCIKILFEMNFSVQSAARFFNCRIILSLLSNTLRISRRIDLLHGYSSLVTNTTFIRLNPAAYQNSNPKSWSFPRLNHLLKCNSLPLSLVSRRSRFRKLF